MFKKWQKATALFCLLFSLFATGCGKQPAANPAAPGEKATETQGSQPDDDRSLRVVTNGNFRNLLLNGAETERGYYDSIIWPLDMYTEDSPWMHCGNLIYTDYQTRTRIFLCSTPGCAHNNENCTSYIRYPRGIVLFANAAETRLFCMATGAMDGEVYSEDDIGRIYQMDLDGSNRKELLRLKAYESFSLNDPVLSDSERLYVCVIVTKSATAEPVKELRSINISDGTWETILNLKIAENVFSAYDGLIILGDGEKVTSNHTYEYRSFSMSRNESKKLYECDIGEYSIVVNNTLIIANKTVEDTGAIKIIDLLSGSEKIIDDIPQEAVGMVSVTDLFDDIVRWAYIDKTEIGEAQEYLVNCATGEITKITLRYSEFGGTKRLVPIVAETETQFLVIKDTTDSKLSLTNAEGIPFLCDWPNREVYALISKEDYRNNIPNYQDIEDTI